MHIVECYDLTTLTHIEIEHVQWKQHMTVVGMVKSHAKKNSHFVALMASGQALKSEEKRVFHYSDL